MSIEAMKLMVAEMEYILDCINKNKMPFDGDDFHEALRLGRQAIEQAQKQEPVAYDAFKDWMVREMPPMTTIGNPEWWAKRIYERFIHTSPPQRQPLTEEEICRIGAEVHAILLFNEGQWGIEFARAIEAAHGIKGEA